MERTELEKKLEELTIEYLENHKDRCNSDQRNALFNINLLKGVINTLNGSRRETDSTHKLLSIQGWCRKNQPSQRLWTGLKRNEEFFGTINSITQSIFMRGRGLGRKSWIEFDELRANE